MNQYVVIGSFTNRYRRVLIVWADSTSEAIVKAVNYEKRISGSNFIDIQVAEIYGDIPIVRDEVI